MIYLILLLGLILRLINLNQSLWLDEAINVVAVKTYSLKELITKYALGDFHPPLYHPFLWLWVKIFGSSESIVRMPSVIFGCLTILLTYLITKEITQNNPTSSRLMARLRGVNTETKQKNTEPKNLALLASFLMAIAPYSIYYSQEARMYALEGLLGTLAIYFFLKIVKEEKPWLWISYTTAITLAIYIDYFGFFIPLIPLIFIVSQKKPLLLKKWFISSFISFLCWLPWFPLFIKQFQNAKMTALNIPVWAKVVGGATPKNLALTFVKFAIGRIGFDNKFLYALAVAPILLFFTTLSFKGLKILKIKDRFFLILWFFIPLIISFLVSLIIPIYQPFRLLYLLPACYIFIASGIYSFKENWQRWLSGALVVLISLGGLSFYYFNPRYHRENWREAIKILEQKAKDKDLVVFVSFEPMSPWIYYQKKNLRAVGTSNWKTIKEIKRIFLFRYLWPVFDPNDTVRKEIKSRYHLIDVKEFNGVEWWEYRLKM